MKTRTRKILIIAALVLIPFWAFGDPPVYFAKSVSGQIIDEETGKPLAGVVIVAQWILFEIGLGHGGHYGNTVNIREVVTDKDGKYSIPGWGPRPRPPLKHLDHFDPRLSILKSQYVPLELSNESLGNHNKAMVRTSEWDGNVIKLKKFQGTLEDHAFLLSSLYTGLPHNDKEWKSFPRMVLALDSESRRLKDLGLKPGYGPTNFDMHNFNEIEREFLKGFEK